MGCIITLLIIGAILPTILAVLASSNWSMFWFYLVVAPLAWAGFLTGFYKPFIGGILLIVTGLITIVGYTIIIINTSGVEQESLLLVPLALLIGLVLLASGYSFIPSWKGRFAKERKRDSWECEECGAEIAKTDKTCPKCGVEFEEE
jgi:hypothetical protein